MFQIYAITAILGFLLSLIACRALISAGPIDEPSDPRKAHTAPTPTSGGLGMAIGIAGGLGYAIWQGAAAETSGAALLLTLLIALAFTLIGFVDDARHLDAKLKFALFSALGAAAALTIGVVALLPLSDSLVIALPFWAGLIGTALWVFTLVNCVNFMDGANGLAMGSVAVGLCALAALGFDRAAYDVAALCISAIASIAGFLVWNFPAGRLFAGDSGALLGGAIAALSALILIAHTGLSPFVPPIAFFPLLADALLTLLWRARRGRSLLVAHSEHVYQIGLRAWGHVPVALVYWAAMAVCAALAFLASRAHDPALAPLILLGLALAAIVLSSRVRKRAVARGYIEP